MTKENNEVRIYGVKPAHDSDDFPVTQADKDLLKLTIHLMAWHAATTTWKKVVCNAAGELLLDLTNILQNPPVEDDTTHTATSEWLYDHWKNAAAHHAKYTNAEARVLHSPLSIPPASFTRSSDVEDIVVNNYYLAKRNTLITSYLYAPLIFPNGVTITKLTLYGYRDDALADLQLYLIRVDRVTTRVIMASAFSDWTDGYGDIFDDSVGSAVVDNVNYNYQLWLLLNPNVVPTDVKFTGARIDFTG